MDVDGVDGIQNILCAPSFLVPVGELTDGYVDVKTRKVCSCQDNLLGKLIMRQDVVE